MASVVNGIVTSFKAEIGEGIHALSTDTLKMALYADTATLTKATTAYSSSDEITGTAYTAGGVTMVLSSGSPSTNSDNNREYRFDAVTWTNATFTARAALIYNSSKANRAIRIIDFGQNRTVTLADFVVRVPATLPALIMIASG
jgi:hypothetical protein